jgi:endonuclease-3
MRKKEKASLVCELLQEHYPLAVKCYLHHENAWQLLIATILSAQCTDDRVNIVTADLFKKYGSIADFANADIEELEKDIHSTGFFRSKAKSIIGSMQKLLNEFNEEMPSDINILTTFPGVGRKTANVVRSHIFDIQSVIVDTHVKRISKRLGLTKSDDPVKAEFELMKILPKDAWTRYNTQIIAHGRKICKSRKPDCENCCLAHLCAYFMAENPTGQ